MVPDNVVVPQFDLTNPDAAAIPVVPPVVSAVAPQNVEGLRLTRKQLALKILALKVATWLKWNLDVFEKNLPIPKQLFLLRDLCTISFGKRVTIPFTNEFQPKISKKSIPIVIHFRILSSFFHFFLLAVDGNEKAAKFALTFYHRWVLRLQILKDIAVKAARPSMGNM